MCFTYHFFLHCASFLLLCRFATTSLSLSVSLISPFLSLSLSTGSLSPTHSLPLAPSPMRSRPPSLFGFSCG